MSWEIRVKDFITSVATDYKQIRSWITGSSSGTLDGLNTTAKSSLISAINEVHAAAPEAPAAATENAAGIVELATLTEMATGTDPNRVATVAGVRQERTALKNEILGGVGAMADTLAELYALAQSAEETAAINNLITIVNDKADAANVYTKAELGDVEADLEAYYAAAKA